MAVLSGSALGLGRRLAILASALRLTLSETVKIRVTL